MSFFEKSLLSVQNLDTENIKLLFSRAKVFKEEFRKSKRFDHLIRQHSNRPIVVAMVFLEPSTRTRVSFQSAAYRFGFQTIIFDSATSSSMQKGESQYDTLRNISAMLPDLMVVRYGNSPELEGILDTMNCPVISAGSGTGEHPTQALLDAFTILEARGSISGQRVLMVGDVVHSRVANSNIQLLTRLGAEVGICGPEVMLPPALGDWKNVKRFSDLRLAVSWCQVLMGLRIQKERHEEVGTSNSDNEIWDQYRVDRVHLESLSDNGIILHPGPVIRGVEFSSDVLQDRRCLVLEQVTNGLFVRAALYSLILGLEV
jgi:aspartate carbamoyltransferase catalytic subunit